MCVDLTVDTNTCFVLLQRGKCFRRWFTFLVAPPLSVTLMSPFRTFFVPLCARCLLSFFWSTLLSRVSLFSVFSSLSSVCGLALHDDPLNRPLVLPFLPWSPWQDLPDFLVSVPLARPSNTHTQLHLSQILIRCSPPPCIEIHSVIATETVLSRLLLPRCFDISRKPVPRYVKLQSYKAASYCNDRGCSQATHASRGQSIERPGAHASHGISVCC